MTTLITGGNGFLGTALKKHFPTAVCPRSKDYDLVSQERCRFLFWQYNPDVVIHLAATVGGIGANKANPGRFCYENLMMGANVVEGCHKYGVSKLVVTSTICSYPMMTPVPFKEEDLWNGFPSSYPESTNAPYGLAKKLIMVLGQGYREQYGLNAITLLIVNLYGPNDHFDLENSHVIPAMIRKFHAAKVNKYPEVFLWGDGSPTREFLYVEDAAEAISLATEKYEGKEPINIGSGMEISMSELANQIRVVVGYEGEIIWDKSKPNGQPRRCLDVSRAKSAIGWEAKTPFSEGLKKTYEWYVNNRKATRVTCVHGNTAEVEKGGYTGFGTIYPCRCTFSATSDGHVHPEDGLTIQKE
jgi:GDP-L-fucose synthase